MPNRKHKHSHSHHQKGGASTDYASLFYAQTAIGGPAAISRSTLKYIDRTPMFNPLESNTIIPGSSGIIPTGLFLAQSPAEQVAFLQNQSGGAERDTLKSKSLTDLRRMLKNSGVNQLTTPVDTIKDENLLVDAILHERNTRRKSCEEKCKVMT